MSYLSEQSNVSQPFPSTVDSSNARKIQSTINTCDETDLVILDYIGRQDGRGVTVIQMIPVTVLSPAATSNRLRCLSDPEYGRLEIALLERRKFAGPQGADLYFLAWDILPQIQATMAEKGYSYESYHAKRKQKKQSRRKGQYENWGSDDLENESTKADSDRSELHSSENEDTQEELNSSEPDVMDSINGKEVEDSHYSNEDTQYLDAVIVRLVKEMADIKQENVLLKKEMTDIKQENVLLKNEIANLKSQFLQLEQKLANGSSVNRLMAKLDQVLASNQTQNGKAAH